jgi:hypothetical protein
VECTEEGAIHEELRKNKKEGLIFTSPSYLQNP